MQAKAVFPAGAFRAMIIWRKFYRVDSIFTLGDKIMDNGLHRLGSIEILVLLKPQIHRGQRRKKSHYAYGLCF